MTRRGRMGGMFYCEIYDKTKTRHLIAGFCDGYQAQPTNRDASRDFAELALKNGDYDAAKNAFSRTFRNHADTAAGFQYLLLVLRAGQLAEVASVADELEAKGYQIDQLAAVRGTLALRDGHNEEALSLLQLAADSQLHPDLSAMAQYNLGLALYRHGKLREAMLTWQKIIRSCC